MAWYNDWANAFKNFGNNLAGIYNASSNYFNPQLTSRVNYDAGGTWQGADILGQLMSSYTNSARDWSLQDREYTAQREDSAVQRHVADLKAAGLNPWLAVQNGSLSEASSSASQVGRHIASNLRSG